MTVRYKELYLVSSIEALNKLAKDIKFHDKGFDKRVNTLESLYKTAQENLIDQEKTYVLLYRFLLVFENYKGKNDHFMEIRFQSQVAKAKQQFAKLREELCRRYKEKAASQKENKKPVEKADVVAVSGKKFPDNHITCAELYSALNDGNNNILLVDARPAEDFKQSRIKIGNIINVPDHVIQSGLSAHCIGQNLPSNYQEIWNKRDHFDVIVLLDWNSTHENMKATKLEKLLSSLVDWDTNKTYIQKPIILEGGYMEWGQKYPSLSINPNIVMNKLNDELDELLNLEDIQYPSDENKVPIITFQETTTDQPEPVESTETREQLIQKNKELAMQSKTVLRDLIAKENEWKELQNDRDVEQLKELEKGIANLEKQLVMLTDEKKKTQQQFELYARFDPEKENLEANHIKEIADIEESENQKLLILEAINQERLDKLAKARTLKPKAAGDPNVILTPSPSVNSGMALKGGRTDTPIVNRANKPSVNLPRSGLFDGPIVFNPEGGGLIGLKNIRNTCYMNTVVQCMRNIPIMAALFCTGKYNNYVKRKPDIIIMETASLFRSLWSNIHKFYNPINFYEKVCSIEPNYQMGNHEDCMEFFLFLLNNLSEDCAYDLTKHDKVMTTSQEAWFNQMGGKNSIFIELFYHQLRIRQICKKCNITSIKFEMESTFMLPVPEHDFRVEDLMKNYLQDYIIDDYVCSKCKRPVTNSKNITYAPKILVIVLKRYKQVINNNNVSVSKVDSKVSFSTSFLFGNTRFNLNGIAMHSGSMTSGHYTAACLTHFKWYEYNDEIVRPINIDDDMVRSKACAFFYSREN
ncbi:hypothetical protein WA026_008691 [Henosepilachna vigintioctopunctata]|uniref:ubiquitinyl hydrolase 1 n=1 Tax=Henosepilachna vigintioctopunctata TaxID=420089 RepID=A0AAW1VD60_9CUCU